ncbi:MAG: AMP-binding protein [Rhodospirillales bacterium]|nr:AMP-binding protein [Rhodospirillales bacterium]
MITLSATIRYHAHAHPERLAIIYGEQRVTYADLYDRLTRVAGLLRAQGIGRGDVVLVLMKNSTAFIEIALAVSHLGAVFLPVNFRLSPEEVAYIADNAGAKIAFVDTELAANAPRLDRVVVVDAAAQADMRRACGGAAPVIEAAHCRPDEMFRLMYTSGTTDRPKGVMHNYENFYWKCLDHVIVLGLTRDEKLLVVGPLYHVGAFDLPGVALLLVGGTMCVLRDFDAGAALAAIETERLSCGWMAPVMLNAILAHPDGAKRDLTSFKWCIGGGEKTPESRIRGFTTVFTHGRYIDAYGLTESCSGDTMMEAGREIDKIGSTGRVLPLTDIAVMDDGGRPLPAMSEGEICLRGPRITRGYWKDEAKTAASYHGDWFRTGDVGYLDPEGFLYLTDRKKDMIISGGENIASSEVERVIYALPQVSEAAVVGVPDERWGERPVAVVVLKPGTRLTADELVEHCGKHLARFKVPRTLVLRDALPRNPSGKVLKRVIRQELAGTPAEETQA